MPKKTKTRLSKLDAPVAIAGYNPYIFLIGGLFFTGLIIASCFWLYKFSHQPAPTPAIPISDQPDLKPTAKPDLKAAAALPTDDQIEEQSRAASDALRSSPKLPLWSDGADAFSLAWAVAANANSDAQHPLEVSVGELLSAKLSRGTKVALGGSVVESAPAPGHSWQRVLFTDDSGRFADLICREVIQPGPRRIEGIYLGSESVPSSEGPIECPILAGVPVEATSIAADSADPWAQIDDERMLLEREPYYHLLEQVAAHGGQDPEFATAPSLNENAANVYANANEFRGKPFSVTGTVVRSWVDERVAQDKPGGVQRVVRILLHKRDWAFNREKIQNQVLENRLVVTHLYEVAAITDQPLPKNDEVIVASGRFLKFLARPYTPVADGKETFRPQSDKVYALFVVSPGFEVAPPWAGLPIWSIGVVVLAVFYGAILARYGFRERREHRKMKAALAESQAKRNEQRTKLGLKADK